MAYQPKPNLLLSLVFLLTASLTAQTSAQAAECAPQTYCQPVCCDDECEFTAGWLRGDLLCWTMREESNFGTSAFSIEPANGVVLAEINRHTNDLRYKWNLGFRIGAGYNFPCDDWDVAVYWTNFRDKTKKHKCGNFAKHRLIFNTVDTIMGYRYFYEPCFSIKPFMGFRWAEIDQKIRKDVEATFTLAGLPSVAIDALLIAKQKFWGVGPMLGFEADWQIGCGWSAYASLGGSFLYGQFRVKNEAFAEIFPFAAELLGKHRRRPVQMGLDGALGLRWDINIATLQIGLEHHRYFDFNQINKSALDLFGANASLTFHF